MAAQGVSSSQERQRVVVVGGGITGLATAWYLRAAGRALTDVTLVEAGTRLGGKIHTAELAGVPVEAGPDTFLARVPWARDLCRELGLGDELVAPVADKAYLWCRGRLRPLPAGLVLGVPTKLRPLVQSKILSTAGVARVILDVVLPRRHRTEDPSLAEVIGERLGREALELLVEPVVGGINAARADQLSLRSSAPQLAIAAERNRSVILGLRRERHSRRGAAEGPVFQSVKGGLGRVVDRLGDALSGAEIRLGTEVASVMPDDGRWRVICRPGPDVVADAVVLTVPAFAAARIVGDVCPSAAGDLAAIKYASVVTATLAYESKAVARPLDGSGFLVPRRRGGLVTACTWSTTKWPALQRSGLVLMRPSAGRFGDERAIHLDDEELVARLHEELSEMTGVIEAPVASLVSRWPRSFPQYEPGHDDRVRRVESALADMPGVLVAGAAYRGLGIASCIQQGERAAGRVATLGRTGDT